MQIQTSDARMDGWMECVGGWMGWIYGLDLWAGWGMQAEVTIHSRSACVGWN